MAKCLLRNTVFTATGHATATPLNVDDVERQGSRVIDREMRRRERLLRVLPVDMQEKLRNDRYVSRVTHNERHLHRPLTFPGLNRMVCFSPYCAKEFYGSGRVVRRYSLCLPAAAPSDGGTDPAEAIAPSVSEEDRRVVLHFCSMGCASFSVDTVPVEQMVG